MRIEDDVEVNSKTEIYLQYALRFCAGSKHVPPLISGKNEIINYFLIFLMA